MKLSLELDFCTQLIWHLFSFVIIQASASIPYWPQNDGSSLELGEFTITKRFYNQVHIKLFSPFKYLLHEIFSCKIGFKSLTYWLLLRFSSESGSYTTTTLQLTHGSFTPHHTINLLMIIHPWTVISGPSKKVRTVWHLQYSGWQDHGCPEDVSFCLFTLSCLNFDKTLWIQWN